MSFIDRRHVPAVAGAILAGLLMNAPSAFSASARARGADPDTVAGFAVDGEVALHALISLGDGHLRKLADELTFLAASEEARSADWDRIHGPLGDLARQNVASVLWFALPDGTYWTVNRGRVAERLSDRAYFSRVLAGESVIGDLVVSRSTNLNAAIVAVPVRSTDGDVIGVLGGSIRLDLLSARLRQELGELGPDFLFFAIDEQPLGALHSDPALIFTEPMKLGDPGMQEAFRQILSHEQGIVRYAFQGRPRTVYYERSPFSGWWYGFGHLGAEDTGAQ